MAPPIRPTRAALLRYARMEAVAAGERVRARRKAMGLTLESLAALHEELLPQTVSKIERGEIVSPQNDLKLLLACTLLCEPAELFPLPTRAAVLRAIA